jgi:hypothetical protein
MDAHRRVDMSWNHVLLCPKCGGNNLHHDAVAVFDRSDENGPIRATLVDDAVTVKIVSREESVQLGNPSDRRSGLAIDFLCESCGSLPGPLTIEQHKGETYMKWSFE